MSIDYSEPAEVDYGDYSPEGEMFSGFVTKPVAREGVFGEAVYALARQAMGKDKWAPMPHEVLMTTESRWSGYSEYTVTDTWEEVVLTIPRWNWEKRFGTLPAFFAALSAAAPAPSPWNAEEAATRTTPTDASEPPQADTSESEAVR